MSSSGYYTISNALSVGAIIAIVVGSIGALAVLIGIIIVIVCIVKHSNRRRNLATQGMILQPAQPYPYPQSWANQYPPNTTSVANYPPAYPTLAAPYTAPTPDYIKPM
jgi:hypothetical protein